MTPPAAVRIPLDAEATRFPSAAGRASIGTGTDIQLVGRIYGDTIAVTNPRDPVMTSGKSYTAGHFELRVEGHTLMFSEALLPQSPSRAAGTFVLRRGKSHDMLLSAWHRSGAKKNCTLFVYNTHGGQVGRYFFMGAQVVKIETGRFTTPGQGPVPSINPTDQVSFNFQKVEV